MRMSVNYYPIERKKERTKVDNEEPDHDNCGPSPGSVGWPVILKCAGDTSNDQVTTCHSQCSHDKHRFSAKLVHVHDGWNRSLLGL